MAGPTARIRGHENGCFYHCITRSLAGFFLAVLRELAARGMACVDRGGNPWLDLQDAEAFLGTATITLEADLSAIGMPCKTPLRLVYSDTGHLYWWLHSALIARTPGTWSVEQTAEQLTEERFVKAYRVFLGHPAAPRNEP
jgi:hypothetical protein